MRKRIKLMIDAEQLIDADRVLDEYMQGLMDELPYDFRERVLSAQRLAASRRVTLESIVQDYKRLGNGLDRLSELDGYFMTVLHAISDIVQKLIFLQVLMQAKREGMTSSEEQPDSEIAEEEQ
jgi:hypothetical protein